MERPVMRCRICAKRVRFFVRANVWRHINRPKRLHAPIPVELSESELRAMHGDR